MALKHTARGWWLADAGDQGPSAPLDGDLDADVAIVGGGYTGMWTAWFVSQLEPGARVVIVEADRCGAGPSGRNGGFVNEMWFSLPTLRRRFGDAAALDVARASGEAVAGVGRWCEEQGVDAWYRHGGYLQASTAPAYDDTWRQVVAACEELGVPEVCRPLTGAEVRARCGSPLFRAGAFYPGAATVHPARLALGLRSRLLERGVSIFEDSAKGAYRFQDALARLRIQAEATPEAIDSFGSGLPVWRKCTPWYRGGRKPLDQLRAPSVGSDESFRSTT